MEKGREEERIKRWRNVKIKLGIRYKEKIIEGLFKKERLIVKELWEGMKRNKEDDSRNIEIDEIEIRMERIEWIECIIVKEKIGDVIDEVVRMIGDSKKMWGKGKGRCLRKVIIG